MKKLLFILCASLLFSGCNLLNQPTSTTDQTTPTPSATTTDLEGPILDGNIINLLVTEKNFSIDEISATEGDTLIISVRNQLEEPINVVVSELGVKSPEIGFGQTAEVTIPTDKPGDYTMFSSLGNQRKEGFETLIIIDEKEEEE